MMRKQRKQWQSKSVVIQTLMLVFAGSSYAQQVASLPSYRPEQHLLEPQIIRSWGEPQMGELMRGWEKGFGRYEPAVGFSDKLLGTETAQAGLFTHVADLALMNREILMLERHVMFRREHHLPLEILVATGSFDDDLKSCALAVFVARSNPISKISLAQLDGIFGDQRTGAWDDKFIWHPEFARGSDRNLRTWGQLQKAGERSDRPIHVYGYPVTIYSPTSGPMFSFRRTVMQGGDIWNPDLQEYPDGKQMVAAMASDPYSIGYTCLSNASPLLKHLPIAGPDASNPISLTRSAVEDRTYPLARSVYIYIDRPDEGSIDPKVKEFLRFVLSREGQQIVAQVGGYLPLTPTLVREQLLKLR